MSEDPRLFGSRAIVTGAADGIGEAIVRTFVKQGASVFAVDRADTGIDSVYRGLRGVTPFESTVSDQAGADELLESASDALDGLDVLICNVGLQARTPIGASDTAAQDEFIERKIAVSQALASAALPYLERSPAGRIVLVGSLRSSFTMDGADAFVRCRDALADLTRTLAERAGPDGITVNYVQPGAIMTPASRRVFNDDKALRDHCIQGSAARRLGEPVDVAKVVLFLASDDAVFVSGTGIAADGGSAAS